MGLVQYSIDESLGHCLLNLPRTGVPEPTDICQFAARRKPSLPVSWHRFPTFGIDWVGGQTLNEWIQPHFDVAGLVVRTRPFDGKVIKLHPFKATRQPSKT